MKTLWPGIDHGDGFVPSVLDPDAQRGRHGLHKGHLNRALAVPDGVRDQLTRHEEQVVTTLSW